MQAQRKFPELAAKARVNWGRFISALAATAACAEPSAYEHTIDDQGFLDGTCWGVDLAFAYRLEPQGLHVIVTTLTRDEVAGHGASRPRELQHA